MKANELALCFIIIRWAKSLTKACAPADWARYLDKDLRNIVI